MNIFDEVKTKVSMKDVLEMYGIYPSRGTNIYKCPFHSDSKPSANIIKGCEKFHCFPCDLTLDIIDFVQKKEGCGVKTAITILDKKFKLGLYRQLSQKEKLELARLQKQREKEKQEKLFWQNFENVAIEKIFEKLKDWQLIRKEISKELWNFEDLFYYANKEQAKLCWLYNILCGFETKLCEYDFIYGNDKKEILEKIYMGEIWI